MLVPHLLDPHPKPHICKEASFNSDTRIKKEQFKSGNESNLSRSEEESIDSQSITLDVFNKSPASDSMFSGKKRHRHFEFNRKQENFIDEGISDATQHNSKDFLMNEGKVVSHVEISDQDEEEVGT
jgi:hypothetical protein